MNQHQQFSKWSLEWLEFHRSKVKLSSYRMYLFKINKINTCFGNCNINKITPLEIQKFLNGLAQNEKFVASTIKKYRITLAKVFNYVMQMNIIKRNPCSLTDIPKTIENPPRRSLTENELHTVVKITKANTNYLYPLVLLFTGLRRSECLALEWKDFDFKNNRIHIWKVLLFDHTKPYLEYVLKNGSRERYIPFPTQLKKILNKTKQELGWLFSDENGNLLTETDVDKQWRKFLKLSGLEITQHMTRHTYASMLYYAGIDVKTAQQFLGHKNVTSTLDIYTHLDNENLNLAAKKFDDYLIKKIENT